MRVNCPLPSPKREGFLTPKSSLTPIIMIQNLEQYRNRRTAETRRMTSGANALNLQPGTEVKPILQIVNPITELPLSASIPEEICNSSEGWIAPKAGIKAKEIQSKGLSRKDRILSDYATSGEYTPDVARSSYNAFMRMAIATGDGNILNISGATELPQGVNPNDIMEQIGRRTLGGEVKEAARYGRISLMVADVDVLDYSQLFTNFTEATKEVNSAHFEATKAAVLNGLQDKRQAELLADATRARGVVEGTIGPDIAAMGPEAAQKEYFLWAGKREEGTIKGINPDGDWQDIEELAKAPDIVTQQLMDHEISLLKNVAEGKIRIIFIGDNESYVIRCCGSASESQQEMSIISNKQQLEISSELPHSQQTEFHSKSPVSSGGAPAVGYDSENCSSCSKSKYKENGCKCSS